MNEMDRPVPPTGNESKTRLKRHFFLVVAAIAFAMVLFGQGFGGYVLGLVQGVLLLNKVPISGALSFLFMYLAFFGIVVLVLLYCVLFEKPSFRSFGCSKNGGQKGNTWKLFFLGLLLGFGMNAFLILLAWLHGDLDLSVGRFEFLYLLCALLCVCVQSGAEELVTRGYMMGALRERYPIWVAIAVNSVFFGALHLMNPGITVLSMLMIILYGLFCSLIVYYLDSLWLCIAIHTSWNFTQNFLFGLPNSGIVSQGSFLHLEAATSSLFYDAVFGVEGSLTGAILYVLLCAGLIFYGEKKKAAP